MAEDRPDLEVVVHHAVSDAINGYARQVSGVELPGLMWRWNHGITEDSSAVGVSTEIDVERMRADLRMWAEALSLEQLALLPPSGYIRYTGVLPSKVQVTVTGYHPDV
ncbi:hypothetical protein [Nocardia macrotermitis]|uniref:Uncharacterized protein n=1 Tax=Nocardia macrotermitis TaxID=2585198 RepID=A0A7K0D8W6_9NOCA|nr:hypothetical protein [Nocardia macrotermitis]MQY22039.1 hypothetical protein [Nocardia macrotermitis]